ncbi:MAG: hypothetical protein ABFS34_07740 [Gemmatimonadota bacterium]
MLTPGWRIFLVLFSGAFFAGAGAAVALGRFKSTIEETLDFSLLGAGMVFFFASLLLVPSAGVLAVPAYGVVVAWVGYIVAAHRLELFRIETGPPEPSPRPVRGAPPPAR